MWQFRRQTYHPVPSGEVHNPEIPNSYSVGPHKNASKRNPYFIFSLILLFLCLLEGLAIAFLGQQYVMSHQAWVKSPVPPSTIGLK